MKTTARAQALPTRQTLGQSLPNPATRSFVNLSSIVPWGRSLDEYAAMFALTDADLGGRVLGCGDGPASFNAEATIGFRQVISVDPIYAFAAADIEGRISATFTTVVGQLAQHADRYMWSRFANAEALGAARLNAMRRFLVDYDTGKAQGRYVEGTLPELPFPDANFSLGLCSHLLFLYSDQLSADMHVASLRELLRVATEVRIFPLVTLSGEPSPHLSFACDTLERDGYSVDQERVPYEFQRGGHTMLRLRRSRAAFDNAAT